MPSCIPQGHATSRPMPCGIQHTSGNEPYPLLAFDRRGGRAQASDGEHAVLFVCELWMRGALLFLRSRFVARVRFQPREVFGHDALVLFANVGGALCRNDVVLTLAFFKARETHNNGSSVG